MKKAYLLLAVVFTLVSCNCQKKAVENNQEKLVGPLPKLEYVANTRGFFQKIVIENQNVSVYSDRNDASKVQTVKVSDADEKELRAAFDKVSINNLATYKDPTQKRFYDGAAIANLKVTQNGTEYKTVDFDHGFPPVEIQKLVNKITSFGKKD